MIGLGQYGTNQLQQTAYWAGRPGIADKLRLMEKDRCYHHVAIERVQVRHRRAIHARSMLSE